MGQTMTTGQRENEEFVIIETLTVSELKLSITLGHFENLPHV